MSTLIARVRRTLAGQDGNLAPVTVLSLWAVMVTGMFAILMTASMATSVKNMSLVDAGSDVAGSFAEEVRNKSTEGYTPGDATYVQSTNQGLTRRQGLVLGENQLITGFDQDGGYIWGPAQGVEGTENIWMRGWGE